MKLSLHQLKLKGETERVNFLLMGTFFFLALGLCYELIEKKQFFGFFLEVFFCSLFFVFIRRLFKRLFYSFWTFAGLSMLFIFYKLCGQAFLGPGFFSFLLAGTLLGIAAYTLFNPIFYPVVSWWEYDFRYRDDLKIKIEKSELQKDGRLTDLRRGAGCVVAFQEFETGEVLKIMPVGEFSELKLEAEIMSKRRYSLGRPYSYGVKFYLETVEERFSFKKFSHFWNSERKLKKQKKFKKNVIAS